MIEEIPEILVLREEMQAWRRDIHCHPETAFDEVRTAAIVAKALRSFGLEVHEGIAKTGVVAVIRNGDGPCYGLRADMDALHIQEETGLEYQSVYPGKMHACGHDGHTAMLLGAAKYLSQKPSFRGTLYFVFQPAEENEGGARVMLEEGLLQRFPMDAIFGLHNFPGLKKGSFAIRAGAYLAACDSFHIEIKGKGCHAATPHDGIDSILIGAEIVQAIQKIAARETTVMEPVVISTTKFHGGDALNACPETVRIDGSCRYFSADLSEVLERRISDIVRCFARAGGAIGSVNYCRRYPPLVNALTETDVATKVAVSLVGSENVERDASQVMGSEDFAYFLQEIPGAYIALGAGNGEVDDKPPCMLHSAQYDFEDDILTVGASYWVRLADQLFGVEG